MKTGRSDKRPLHERFHDRYEVRESGCWVWTGKRDHHGYGLIMAHAKTQRAPRVAWALLRGEIPDGLHICHHCDNPPCVNPDHLFLGTAADNSHDHWRKGRGVPWSRRGDGSKAAKLTTEDVRSIRKMRDDGCLMAEIGRRFNVGANYIGMIINGKAWSYLP
jgi:hypothetical protein